MTFTWTAVIVSMLVGNPLYNTNWGDINYYPGFTTLKDCKEFISNQYRSWDDAAHWTNNTTLYVAKDHGSHYSLSQCKLEIEK